MMLKVNRGMSRPEYVKRIEANKEQRKRRKAIQRNGQRLQLWAARYPEGYEDPRHQARLQYQGD